MTLALGSLGSLTALPAHADDEVVYDCYSGSGRLVEEEVSQIDAIAFTLFGSRGSDGIIRGLGGECRPQEQEEEQQTVNSDRSVDVTYVSSKSIDNDQVEVTWSYKGTNYTYTSEVDSYYIRNRREARPARDGERAALRTAYQRATNSSPSSQEELRRFGFVPEVGQFAVVRNTYEERNSVRQFDAMINDDRQRWIANCRTEQLFNASRQEVKVNSRAIGDIVAFVCTENITAQNPDNNEDLRSFGNMPGYGDFSVVRNTYYASNAILEFDAIVVGQRQRWDANCRTGELFDANDRRLSTSSMTRSVASFVCRDGSNN
ncbi:hypothetical protein Pse7367_1785 [Thalassoporum mexicanum PCC 7367]|nr:hypothetical protein Pse7367_1785 [Pseudanabaena sp. PCC 7367]